MESRANHRRMYETDNRNQNNCVIHSNIANDYRTYMTPTHENESKFRPSKFALFCEVSSVRGMHKIYKSQATFLKSLWIGFVFSMSILLIIISTNLVIDFRNYHTAWHITTELDEKTRFPAISICSHNPFSTDANDLWKEGKVLTPKQFRKRLFEAEMEFLKTENQIGTSLQDKADEYYGNVDYPSSKKLGHKRGILQYCVIQNDGFTVIAENCEVENETGFTVTQFSHYNYFNCFTIEEKNNLDHINTSSTNDTISLIILINVNLFSDLFQANESFVMDTLTRGEGLRLVIHQVGTYPDIDKSGINIQPGKMNEITFQNVQWTRYSSPKRECRDNQPPIVDLDRVYNYTFIQCLDAIVNKELIEKCRCMSTIWPRPQAPSKVIPYCNDYSGNLTEINTRIKCAFNEVYQNLKAIKSAAVGTKCWPVCTFNTYDSTLSITRWKPSLHKLRQISRRYRSVNTYDEKIRKARDDNNISLLIQLKNEYIEELNKDLNFVYHASHQKTDDVFNEQQMNYVHLVRKNFDTTKRIEKLFIDIYIFISRVGGLCSLCIGLTTAFFIEIIEFIYLCIFQKTTQPKDYSSDMEHTVSNFDEIQLRSSSSYKGNRCDLFQNQFYGHGKDPVRQSTPINHSPLSVQLTHLM